MQRVDYLDMQNSQRRSVLVTALAVHVEAIGVGREYGPLNLSNAMCGSVCANRRENHPSETVFFSVRTSFVR